MSQEIIPASDYLPQGTTNLSQHVIDAINTSQVNLLDISNLSMEAVHEMLMIARQSQHPKAYEVLAKMISAATAANRELSNVAKDRHVLENPDDAPVQQKTINNNVFVGSTADLQQLINKRREIDESN